jgi:uncharacterized BrkB/YihY/UPF0761 family membrane protein
VNSLSNDPFVSALTPILLAIPRATVLWSLFGLVFILFLIYCLRTGEIPNPDGAPYTRIHDHFHYNAYIFWAALMAVIFIGAAIAFYYYPNASKPMIRDELPSNF